jgi:fructose-1,6-bisphosphatase/inositol monophosphatase family enzyme
MLPKIIPPQVICEFGLQAMAHSLEGTQILMSSHTPALKEVKTAKLDNITRLVDEAAELATIRRLFELANQNYRDHLEVWGEESITNDQGLSFHKTDKTVALLDMIDGTDLLYRGFSNWCSAMVFFFPPKKRILASLVGFPNGDVFGAIEGEPAFRTKSFRWAEQEPLQVPKSVPPIDQCAVGFYGQKAENLLSIFGSFLPPEQQTRLSSSRFGNFLAQIESRKPPFRIYNLGGNPMMVKVADGKLHAIFELLGQKPHDVVPGAFIARAAGAIVRDLDGNELDLAEALMTPNAGAMKYIIAANEELYVSLRNALGSQPD